MITTVNSLLCWLGTYLATPTSFRFLSRVAVQKPGDICAQQ